MADTSKPPNPEDPDAAANQRTTAVRSREGAVTAREGTATRREETAGVREDAADVREESADRRDEAAQLRDDAFRAGEDVAHPRTELDHLVIQMREANARLVVGSVRAHTMTEEAEEANQLKDEFLATVSHELRTPLSAILGWSQALRTMNLPHEPAGRAIAIIERNALALGHIIDDLLDVSRGTAGSLRVANEPVDIVAVARAALEALRPLAATKHLDLVFSPGSAVIGAIRGDAGRLQQVLWNLIANSIKFTPEGGRVEVLVRPSNDHVEIRVADTGEGITPELLPHVFERFRQSADATTRRHSGLGLGLAIVQRIVALHGGTVHAASPGTGQGATFTVCLPVGRPSQSP
jgi:signal transduction histidine kinase